ncbi:MAG: NlpC/P60 family protein [Bacteroidetes bacterium]|nr:NlpC/P60 family protein [Bacteroidota bacterium]
MLVFVSCKHKKHTQTKNSVSNNNNIAPSKIAIVEEKLGVNKQNIEKSKLYSFIADWYGTPYKYGGCDKNGTDCSCFTNILFRNVYNKNTERSSGDIYKTCDKIKKSNLQEGDLVFFVTNGKSVSHVGIYIKDEKFVHASTSKGVMISSLEDAYFKKTYYGSGRLN